MRGSATDAGLGLLGGDGEQVFVAANHDEIARERRLSIRAGGGGGVFQRELSVATCGYNWNMETGVRELRDNLSRYIRRIEAGERVVVTAHGRAVAELVPPATRRPDMASQFARLIASGVIIPPAEGGDPLEDCPEIRLPPGTAAALIDSDRGEA